MKKVVLKYNDLVKIIQEQVNGEYYDITPEKYLELMELASYDGKGLSRIKKFQGKPLRITGSLDISGTPVKDLGNVAIIDGNLDISNTNVMSVDGIDIRGSVRDWNSGAYKARMRKIQLGKLAEADGRREENEWSLNNEDIDDVGLKANALYEYLTDNGTFERLDDDDKLEIERIKVQIKKLTDDYDDEDDPELADAIYDQIAELEDELTDLESDKYDVYNLYPSDYGNYGLTSFEVLEGDDGEYSVGTEEEMERAALEQIENFIDDVGIEGFRPGYVDDYIDEDQVARWFEDMFYDDVRESPESYFDDDDFELTYEQLQRIDQLESQIQEYEEQQSEADSDEYDEYQELIDELQEELDDIEVDKEPTEEMIENAVEERLYDVKRNPVSYIDDYGLDIKNFIDIDELIKGVYQDDGYTGILTYDGTYDVVDVKGVDYYVFRTN